MKTRGTINVWFETKQYGFIFQEKDNEIIRTFLHANNIISGIPRTGADVLFHPVITRKGLLAILAEILDGGTE